MFCCPSGGRVVMQYVDYIISKCEKHARVCVWEFYGSLIFNHPEYDNMKYIYITAEGL